LCDRWLGEIEGLGSSRIAEVLRHCSKDCELMHGEIRRYFSWSRDDPFLFRHANSPIEDDRNHPRSRNDSDGAKEDIQVHYTFAPSSFDDGAWTDS
jgi:hypothetical protein